MSCQQQRTIFNLGSLDKRPTLQFVLIPLVCAFLTTFNGVAQWREPAQAASFDARRESSLPRVDPAKYPAAAAVPRIDRLGDHYLMLVNTAVAKHMDAQKMAQFNRSPYDGLAVAFVDAYETSPVPSLVTMRAQITSWKNSAGKDIWPWVYLNRMIGADPSEEGNPLTKTPYFQRFQGLDLEGKTGAQNDFLENWRDALRLAKETRVPGIVCDLEFYNNYARRMTWANSSA